MKMALGADILFQGQNRISEPESLQFRAGALPCSNLLSISKENEAESFHLREHFFPSLHLLTVVFNYSV